MRVTKQNRKWLQRALALLLIGSPAFGESIVDHRSEEPSVAETPVATKNTGSPRGVLLAEGLRQAGLSVPALKAVEQAFRISPDVDSERFDGVVNQLEKDRGIVSRVQAEDLKRLYREALSGVQKNAGKEVSDAARSVLSQTAANAPITSALKGAEGAVPPAGVSDVLKGLEEKLEKATSQQESAKADDFLSERGVFNLLQDLLGKEKDGDRSSGRSEASAPRPSLPPPGSASKGAPPENERKRDDHNRLLDAVSKRDRGAINISTPSNAANNEKKEAEPKKAETSSASPPRKKRSADEVPETKESPKDPSSSILDSLNKAAVENPSAFSLGNKVPLSPIGPSTSADGVPSPQAGGGAGVGGGSPGAGMLGGGGASMGGDGAVSGGDPFSSVGLESGGGETFRMGSGYVMSKDGGYGGAGGGDVSSGYSADSGSGTEDSEAYSLSPSTIGGRTPSYFEQVKSAEPGSSESRASILEKYVGYSRRTLCGSEESERKIGLCENLSSKKKRAEWFKQMEARNASSGG